MTTGARNSEEPVKVEAPVTSNLFDESVPLRQKKTRANRRKKRVLGEKKRVKSSNALCLNQRTLHENGGRRGDVHDASCLQ